MRTWSDLASPPETWPDPDAMSLLQALLLFGGGTLAVTLVIVLLVLAPSLTRGSGGRLSGEWWSEPLWFGGPTGELDADASGRRQLEPPAGASGQAGQTLESSGGGAGARW